MTTENKINLIEADRNEQYKRDTLNSLLCISMEQQGPQKFADLDVKAIAKKVSEAYDQLDHQITGDVRPFNVSELFSATADSTSEDVADEDLKVGPTVLVALPAGCDQTRREHEITFHLPVGMSTGQVSDGYHTFDELYAHRVRLFTCLMHAHKSRAWWSFLHSDGSQWKGWVIAGIDTPAGSATYHLPESAVDDLPIGTNIARGKEWDGHTADDVLERLKSL